MVPTQKLTKKQKKALAFRERKGSGTKANATAMDLEAHGLPVLEEQDQAIESGGKMEMEPTAGEAKKLQSHEVSGLEEAEDSLGNVADKSKSKKRKRETGAEAQTEAESSRKKSKRVVNDNLGDGEVEKGSGGGGVKSKTEHRERYILFVGNLKYTTSIDAITQHFSACDPAPMIRLLTPKASGGKHVTKSKGCAFLEFVTRTALQQALKLHHSELDGRVINVELTVGGGGKGENRLKRLQERNKKLTGQRITRQGKRKGQNRTEGESEKTSQTRSQRYSSTSGLDQKPTTKKTWTVSDGNDVKPNRSRKRTTSSKPLGTGVNAIPIG